MRILDEYYLFEKDPQSKAKNRLELRFCTGESEALLGSSKRWIYLSAANNVRSKSGRYPEERISNGAGKHVSSLYKPDLNFPGFGYGDLKGSTDALLFVISEDRKRLEVFVSKGKKNQVKVLFSLFCDGELDPEIEAIRRSEIRLEPPSLGKAA